MQISRARTLVLASGLLGLAALLLLTVFQGGGEVPLVHALGTPTPGTPGAPLTDINGVNCADVYLVELEQPVANAKPVTPEEFVPLLDKACDDCGIRRQNIGGKVYLMDVQLVTRAAQA